MDVISEIKNLHLPEKQFVVLGSGILSIKGIRQSEDIDLLVTPGVFEELKKQGWKLESGWDQREKICTGYFEAYTTFWKGETVEDFLQRPEWIEVIDGITFMSLQELIRVKTLWAREKDLWDIKLIAEFLNKKQ